MWCQHFKKLITSILSKCKKNTWAETKLWGLAYIDGVTDRSKYENKITQKQIEIFQTNTFAKQSDDPRVYNQPVVEKVTRHPQASVARAAALGWSSVGLDSMVGMLLFPRSVELYRCPRKEIKSCFENYLIFLLRTLKVDQIDVIF